MAMRPNETFSPVPPPDRSYSALDFTRTQPSHAPEPASEEQDSYEPYSSTSHNQAPSPPDATLTGNASISNANEGAWWGTDATSTSVTDSAQQQPLWGSSYDSVDLQNRDDSQDSRSAWGARDEVDEDEEDLGFGNSKTPKANPSRNATTAEDSNDTHTKKEDDKVKDTKAQGSLSFSDLIRDLFLAFSLFRGLLPVLTMNLSRMIANARRQACCLGRLAWTALGL